MKCFYFEIGQYNLWQKEAQLSLGRADHTRVLEGQQMTFITFMSCERAYATSCRKSIGTLTLSVTV